MQQFRSTRQTQGQRTGKVNVQGLTHRASCIFCMCHATSWGSPGKSLPGSTQSRFMFQTEPLQNKKRKTRIMAEHEPAQTSRAFVAPRGRFCHRCWEKHPPAEALPPCRTNRRGEQTLCQGAIAVAQVIPLQTKGPMRPKRTKGSVQTAASDVTSTAHRQLSETTTSML